MSTDDSERPPPYEDTRNDADQVLQPTIHVLAGQTIHAESADAPLLYKLNRGIATLSYATSDVELERVERTVRTDDNDEPTIRERTRHIYDIRHIQGILGTPSSLPSDSPAFYIEAQRRKHSLGNLALKKSRLPGRSSWKALPLDLSGKSSKWNLPTYVKDAKALFEVKQKDGRYEWSDADGNPIAVEDEGEGQHRLVVTASLHRETMDAIVALWCCRLWQYSAEHQEPLYEGMENVRHKFALAKEMKGSMKFGMY
ncbi:hypothetical protein jhhlp_008819 [Lomentospora prolificans]|uniref:Uncharacterized protein n=1 Tax=Lomentospora prolificans TaxID=41688 RepID=A0A2N3MZ40_9PEZI|nr:hypothetical protein jhhlp_008819 [Lomentospora prolificans]